MAMPTSPYSQSSPTHRSDGEHIDISAQNITNNSNNGYRGSLFFEDTPESIRPPSARVSTLNVLNRTSTHSFTVFIDDSRYDDLQSSSSSSNNLNTTPNTTSDSLENIDSHIIEHPTVEDTTNTTNILPQDTSDRTNILHQDTHTILPKSIITGDSDPLLKSTTNNSRLIEIPTPQEPSSIIHQTPTNKPILRRDHTSESMSTGDTEYFEAEDYSSPFNEQRQAQNIPLLKTCTNNEDEYNNEVSARDSADSIDTQDTEILDTRIRNSQSLIQTVRDSIRTVSTMILTQNPDTSNVTNTNRKSNLDSLDEGLGINMSTPDNVSPMRRLTVKNRLSSEIPSNDTSFASTSNTNNNNTSDSVLINNLNHPSGDANISTITEPSYSSLFQYDEYDESIEPDIEQAVQLLKREVKSTVPTVNYVDASNQQNNIYLQENKQREEEDEATDKDKSSSSSGKSTDSNGRFVPHELIIPNKLTISNPPTPIITASESHIPRSPSLINKFLVTPSPKRKSSASSGRRHQRNISLTSHANISPLYGTVSLDANLPPTETSQPSVVPKVHVLQSVSGPNKWKPNPTTKAQMVSLLGSNEFRSPIKKLSFHEDMALSPTQYHYENNTDDVYMSPTELFSAQSNNIPNLEPINDDDEDQEQDIPIALRTTNVAEHITTTTQTNTNTNSVLTPPLPAGVSTFRYNTTIEIPDKTNSGQEQNDQDSADVKTPMYVQHIDSPSIHSFDSQTLKFWEVYSLKRVIMLIIICLIIPPLFFMIYAGSICGMDDNKLMKIVLNKKHRIGLFRGFIWDIDLNWLRTMSLIIGIAEIIIIFACVGIGFGVGLTR